MQVGCCALSEWREAAKRARSLERGLLLVPAGRNGRAVSVEPVFDVGKTKKATATCTSGACTHALLVSHAHTHTDSPVSPREKSVQCELPLVELRWLRLWIDGRTRRDPALEGRLKQRQLRRGFLPAGPLDHARRLLVGLARSSGAHLRAREVCARVCVRVCVCVCPASPVAFPRPLHGDSPSATVYKWDILKDQSILDQHPGSNALLRS